MQEYNVLCDGAWDGFSCLIVRIWLISSRRASTLPSLLLCPPRLFSSLLSAPLLLSVWPCSVTHTQRVGCQCATGLLFFFTTAGDESIWHRYNAEINLTFRPWRRTSMTVKLWENSVCNINHDNLWRMDSNRGLLTLRRNGRETMNCSWGTELWVCNK